MRGRVALLLLAQAAWGFKFMSNWNSVALWRRAKHSSWDACLPTCSCSQQRTAEAVRTLLGY